MTREDLIKLIRVLPEPQLRQAEDLLRRLARPEGPREPVRLSGLWAGYRLTDGDISGIRKDLWGGLDKLLEA